MSYKNLRINDLNMTTLDVAKVMSGGNPGAINVCIQILKRGPTIDPMGSMEGLGPLMMLDTMNVYEDRIWMLYKDVCKQDLPTMIAVIRARQMGFVSQHDVEVAIGSYGKGLNLPSIIKKVTETIDGFNMKG